MEEIIDLPIDINTIKELIIYLENLNENYRLAFEKKNLIKIAINKSYSSLDDKIDNNDEIAFFPPVTGG